MTKNEINMCIELSKYLADNARLMQPRIERVINETSQKVYSYKYGIGGQNLHRGWYCPSIIYDIVIGNASRGRIVKNYRSQTLPHIGIVLTRMETYRVLMNTTMG